MKVTFLGTGSAFTLKNFHTNILLTKNGKNFLIDCGSDIRFSLTNKGFSYKDIDGVYISHAHADHCGGLEYLAFCSYFDPSIKEKIRLYGIGSLIRNLWKYSWKGGLASVQGQVNSLSDYFDIVTVRENETFVWEDMVFQPIETIHIMNGFSFVSSYGLMVKDGNTTVFFTTDTQFAPNQIMDFYKMADVIIQDCETTPFKSGVHANFLDLCTLPEEIKSKMWLTHFQDNVLTNNPKGGYMFVEEWVEKARQNNFLGFVPSGFEMEI